jgi:electron transfer flavoprotein alpha subunit
MYSRVLRRVAARHSAQDFASIASGAHSAAHRRLLASLAVLEQKDGVLSHGSLSAITAAKKFGGSIHGFVAGKNVREVAQEAAKVNGLEKVIMVENEAYEKVYAPSSIPLSMVED